MSDQPANLSSDQEQGIPGNASAEEGATDESKAQVTQQSLDALRSEFRTELNQSVQEIERSVQSSVDKADRRITDRLRNEFSGIDRMAEDLKAIGKEMSPEEVQALKQRALIRGYGEEPVQPDASPGRSPQGQPGETPTTDDPEVTPQLKAAIQLQQEAGVFVLQEDPEFQTIKFGAPLGQMLLSVQQAVDAKKQRLAGGSGDATGEQDGTGSEDRSADLAARSTGAGVQAGRRVPSGSPSGLQSMDYFRRAFEKSKR